MKAQCCKFECQWIGTESEQSDRKCEYGYDKCCPKCDGTEFYQIDEGEKPVKLVQVSVTIQIPDDVDSDDLNCFIKDSVHNGDYESFEVSLTKEG